MIDSRNSARIRYERVNEETGEEVPWDKIVKGYEYDDGNYVLLSEEELENASPELTQTIEIEQFVDLKTSTFAISIGRTCWCPTIRAKKAMCCSARRSRRGQGGNRQSRDPRPPVSGRANCPGRRPGTGIASLSIRN